MSYFNERIKKTPEEVIQGSKKNQSIVSPIDNSYSQSNSIPTRESFVDGQTNIRILKESKS